MSYEQGHDGSTAPFWVTRAGARIALGILYVCVVLSIVLEMIHPFDQDDHGVGRVEALEFLGSYALYGFVGCVVLVLLGRVLRRLVMREEDYYLQRQEHREMVDGDD